MPMGSVQKWSQSVPSNLAGISDDEKVSIDLKKHLIGNGSAPPKALNSKDSSPNTLKYIAIAILLVQNTSLVLTLRYSRRVKEDETPYLASTAVVLTELVKLVVCVAIVFQDQGGSFHETGLLLWNEIFKNFTGTLKVAVPAFLYTIQNNLLYVALSYLDAATFQVSYQLKILTTALFSVIMLGKHLDFRKWIALFILTAAIALIQVPSGGASAFSWHSSTWKGLVAVICACCTSGFSGVYFEKILKGTSVSLWLRNIQLGIFGLGFGLTGVFITDWKTVNEQGFFRGYRTIVFVVILLQALGGLTIAAVIKYADNILKGFATAVTIVLSSLISYFFLNDFSPTSLFVIGTVMVIFATILYSVPVPVPSSRPQKQRTVTTV
jgi:UDP-sugar transporter A1/2/3